jgi:AraC-like DNA-binding protein
MVIYHAKQHIRFLDGVDFNLSGNFPRLHSHDYWEFEFVYGTVTHILNGKRIPLRPNCLLIVRPDDEHAFVDGDAEKNHVNFKITEERLRELLSLFHSHLYDQLCNTKVPLKLDISEATASDLHAITQQCLMHYENAQRCGTLSMIAILKIVEIFFLHLFINEQTQNHYPPIINALLEAFTLPQNFQSEIQAILDTLQISHTHGARLFKKFTGQTMHAFFFSKKMSYACALLKNTDYKISTISESVGFESQSYFDGTFKKTFGMTPSEYRKQHSYANSY